jgi:ribosomal-protein-alanine N-acetyltransferase
LFTLSSDRILLRQLRENDLADFLFYRSMPAVAQYQGYEPYDQQKALEFIQSQKERVFGLPGQWLQLGIIDRKQDRLIGDCAVKLFDETQAELGCTIAPTYQGKGFAKETLLIMLNFLFEEIKVHRIVEITDAENLSSIRLLESIGFRKEGHFIENTWFKGKWGSEIQYALLATEWPAVKKLNNYRAGQ